MSDQATESKKHVVIYTDGSARGNPGPGGFAAILLYGEHRKEIAGGFRLTTNNRMELMAAIAALESLKQPCRVTLHSDSEYLILGASSAEEWRRRDWRLSPRKERQAANPDLWQRLLEILAKHEVVFQWVKGHSANAENERCDSLATQVAASLDLPADEAYEKENPMEKPISADERMRMADADPEEKVVREGQACRKCGTPVERRVPRPRAKPRAYYYEYYLYCPRCRTMYLVEDAKRSLPPTGPTGLDTGLSAEQDKGISILVSSDRVSSAHAGRSYGQRELFGGD